jgi:hypothetical protein
VDCVKGGISSEQTGHSEPTTSGVLDPPPSQRLAQHVARDPKQPRQGGPVALGSEPASHKPSPRKDLGCQIGGMLANPGPRPRKHLSSVPVVDLLEPIGSPCPQEFRVRRPLTLASHTLYLTLPRKMCHASHSLRLTRRPRGTSKARLPARPLPGRQPSAESVRVWSIAIPSRRLACRGLGSHRPKRPTCATESKNLEIHSVSGTHLGLRSSSQQTQNPARAGLS